jgi:SAM-dependent methyltransferase
MPELSPPDLHLRICEPPAPLSENAAGDAEWLHWESTYAGSEYFYGHDPGPVAIRTEKYHRSSRPDGATALDIGCGEGQDLMFLAASGYRATGIDFSPSGLEKTRRLLHERGLGAQVRRENLRLWRPEEAFDLVLSVNVLPFLGEDADAVLENTLHAVRPGGMLGLSLWGRDDESVPRVQDGVRLWTLDEAMRVLANEAHWQMKEVARVWQWNHATKSSRTFVTIIAQRLSV